MSDKIFLLADVYQDRKVKIEPEDNIEFVIGSIIANRIINIAYDNLEISSLPKEVIKILKVLKKNNEKSYDEFIYKMRYLSLLLKDLPCQYALLKGAYLTTKLYPKGKRTSNDIDILINGSDLTVLQERLLEDGFIQGEISESGDIKKASRRDIIMSRMNYGETIPFVKMISKDVKLEVDVNFSLDYKPDTSDDVENMLRKTVMICFGDFSFYTLCPEDFIIHLCCHLYKEATVVNWVKDRRDLMLYKFSDINVFLHTFRNEDFFAKLVDRIHELKLEKRMLLYLFEFRRSIPEII